MAPLPVTEEGSGSEVLFFVHGWPDDEHLWDAQVAHFRERFRCLRVTMPHFAGRARAEELGHQFGGFDFLEGGDLVAATIRAACPGCAVTLVIHGWGSVWGFFAQLRHPELVKAVVAMDLGPPSNFPAGMNWGKVMVAGLAYQHWLVFAFLLARSTAGTALAGPGRWVADGLVRVVARVFHPGVGDKKDLRSDRITADACYPYYFFHTNVGVRGAPAHDVEGPEPSCPCLFLYGKRKPGAFHLKGWEEQLRRRADCRVVAMETGHWMQLERPQEVNRIMQEWLEVTLQRPGGGPSSKI